MSTKKPAVKTTAKKAAPKKAAASRSKPATSSRSASRSKATPVKKPRSPRKPKTASPLFAPRANDATPLYGVTTVQQASTMYAGMSKSMARVVRKTFFAAGRCDLAAAPRS